MCSAHTLSSLPAPHNPLLITVDIMTLGTAEAAPTDQAAFPSRVNSHCGHPWKPPGGGKKLLLKSARNLCR